MPSIRGLITIPRLELLRLPDVTAEVLHIAWGRVEAEAVRLRMVGEDPWVRLRLPDGREGWIREGEGFQPYPIAVLQGQGSQLMEGPSAASRAFVRLRKGAVVSVLRASEDPAAEWVRVRMGSGREGFLHGDTIVVWGPPEQGPGGPPSIVGSRLRWIGPAGLLAAVHAFAGLAFRMFGIARMADARRRRSGPIGRQPAP